VSTETTRPSPRYRWYHKLFSFLAIVACLELGIFLILFPWSRYWDNNFFAGLSPLWSRLWSSAYLRGAVSGLGVLNLYVSMAEIWRLGRFWTKTE
jgi:hypothetical protein